MIPVIGITYKHIPTGRTAAVCEMDDTFICLDSGDDFMYVLPDKFEEFWEPVNCNLASTPSKDSKAPTDRVNHPSYYQDPSGVECINIVRHRDFNIGNAIKYLWRAGLKKEQGLTDKQKTVEDLKKAIFYINDEIKMLEK